VKVSGFDIVANYGHPIQDSRVNARLNVALIKQIDTAFTEGSLPTDLSNTYGNPLRFRARGDLSWLYRQWTVNGAINFSNRYTDTSASPPESVGSFTTVDLTIRYAADKAAQSLLRGTYVSFNAINVFNASPPYVNGGIGLPGVHYDVGNASPLGRFVSITLGKVW
jgi:iron complex outermembrane receptor protein